MGWGAGGSPPTHSSCRKLRALSPSRASLLALFCVAAEELRKLHTEALHPQEGPKAKLFKIGWSQAISLRCLPEADSVEMEGGLVLTL